MNALHQFLNSSRKPWIDEPHTDKPQRLWHAIYELLSQGIEVLIHVGPDPNLLPSTLKRLSDNVTSELTGPSLRTLGMRAVSNMVARPWLAKLMSTRAAVLRAPYIVNVILEDAGRRHTLQKLSRR